MLITPHSFYYTGCGEYFLTGFAEIKMKRDIA
jgi:hypothetical protein